MSERLMKRSLADIQHRDLTARTLNLRAATIDESSRSVEATLSTENPVQVFDFNTFEMIDESLVADGARLPSQMPMLESHNRFSLDSVLGSIRNIRREEGRIVGRLYFAEGDEAAERAWQKVRQGHVTDVSVGYRVDEYVDIPAGQTSTIDGRTYTAGPERMLRVSTKWTPREGSLVSIGADEAATIRNEHQSSPRKDRTMNAELRRFLETRGLSKTATDAEARRFLAKLSGRADNPGSATVTEDDDEREDGTEDEEAREDEASEEEREGTTTDEEDREEEEEREGSTEDKEDRESTDEEDKRSAPRLDRIRAAERKRIQGIQSLPFADEHPELVRSLIEDPKMTIDTAARRILEKQRGRRSPAGHTRRDGRQEQSRALTASVLQTVGVSYEHLPVRGIADPSEVQRIRERAANTAGDRFSGMSMVDLCRACLQAEGRTVPYNPNEAVRAAASTSTFSQVFTDSVNAIVDRAFDTAPDTTTWAEEGEVADFKLNTEITMGEGSGMRKHSRGGRAGDFEWSDAGETFKVQRYAGKFVIDEMDLIDDSFGVLEQIDDEMREDAAMLRPRLVYSILLGNPSMADSTAVFHADRNNTGTAVLDSAGLAAGLASMAKQTRGDRNLNIQAKYLIVPQDLWYQADNLLNSPTIVIAGDTDTTKGVKNPLSSLGITVVTDNYLGAAGVVDPESGTKYTGSATNWFLAAGRRTVKVVYRRGAGRMPQVRSFTLDRGQWGIGFDINLDIGAFARDFRGLYKSTGAGS